jgi:hypothetical protein
MTPGADALGATFAALRRVLQPHAKRLQVRVDDTETYEVCSRKLNDRVGRPMFVASVQMRKSYVSFNLMPIYTCPELIETLSPALRKRMHGKACFNFKAIEAEQLAELIRLTKIGVARFEKIELPWS